MSKKKYGPEVDQVFKNGKPQPVLGFSSITKMCQHHHIGRDSWIYLKRSRRDLSDQERLNILLERRDRNGVLGFKNAKELCRHHKISYSKWIHYIKSYPTLKPIQRLEYLKKGEKPPTELRAPIEPKGGRDDDLGINEKPVFGKRGFYVVRMRKVENRKTDY